MAAAPFRSARAESPDGLIAYWPFDGSPAIALGSAAGWSAPATEVPFGEGVNREAIRLVADCRFGMGEDFPVAEGTFAAWVQLDAAAEPEAPRYLLCLYGDPQLESSWARNRWTLMTHQSRLSFQLFGETPGQSVTAAAAAPNLSQGGWHHVAITWAGVNSAGQEAGIRLYLDGAQVAAASAPQFRVGRTSRQFDLGRDSDNSPDYGWLRMDDAFLYARALTPAEIASGVAASGPGRARSAPHKASGAAANGPGWDAPGLPFRLSLHGAAPKQARRDWSLYATPALTESLRALGRVGAPDLGRARLFAAPSAGDGREIDFQLDGGMISWPVPGAWAAGESRSYRLYFDTQSYTYLAPLAAAPPAEAPGADQRVVHLPDYAQQTYGDAWDFDEGDLEELDGFGNHREMIRDVRVADGALHAQVSGDPYIIWGSMWGTEDRGKRQVRIDLAHYPLLTLRVRQSVPFANWTIFGRPLGSENLLSHTFPVRGTGWQTLRVDLAREAKWSGILSALRLDLTNEVDAEVALDFVRLVRGSEARAGAVETLGAPSSRAARVSIALETPTPVAGTDQRVRVRVEDGSGKPVAGQPLRVWVTGESGAELRTGGSPSLALEATGRRALTGPGGEAEFCLAAGRRAGRSARLFAEAEFADGAKGSAEISVQPGPPSQYRVGDPGVMIVPESKMPLRLRAMAADRCGNPVPLPGRRLEWQIADAIAAQGSVTASADGGEIALAPDMTRRWVYRIRVRDDQGLTGESGPICVLPQAQPERKVVLKEGAFRTPDGSPFVPLGGFYAVWIPAIPAAGEEAGRHIRSFADASEEEMHHWFGFLRAQGVTAMRMMLRRHGQGGTEAMDAGGRVNRRLFARVLRLLDIARQYDLRFMLTLHDDYDKPVYVNETHLENFALPAFEGEDLSKLPGFQRRFLVERDLVSPHGRYLEPDAIACQDQYAREIVGYLKDNPVLFSWELENEMVDCPVSWVNHAVQTIRAVDPVTPVCVSHGGGGLATADPLYWTRTDIDFYTYHLYPLGTTKPEIDYGLLTDVLTRYGRMAGSCFLGESTGDEFGGYPAERDDDRRWIMRDLIWFSLVNRNPGCFFWNARGKEIAEFRLAGEIVRGIPWLFGNRKASPVAVRVAHPLEKDTWYRTAEGRRELTMMAQYSRHFLERGVEFDFVMGETDGGAGQTCDLAKFAPPEVPAQFSPSPGFQVASVTRGDGRAGLLYVRCASGIRPWSPKPGQTMWLRERAPAPLRLQCQEPAGLAGKIVDLDSGAGRALVPGPGGVIDVGRTDHDYAVVWERR